MRALMSFQNVKFNEEIVLPDSSVERPGENGQREVNSATDESRPEYTSYFREATRKDENTAHLFDMKVCSSVPPVLRV